MPVEGLIYARSGVALAPTFLDGRPACWSVTIAAGNYSLQATYAGDTSYAATTSGCQSFTVKQATPTVSLAVDDAATGSAWSGAELDGSAAFAAAHVAGNSGITPSGAVTYSLYNNTTCAGTPTTSGQVTLASDGSVPRSAKTAALTAGSYSYRADYSGDPNYAAARSTCGAFDVGQSKPANSGQPTIAGTPMAGRSLTCQPGTWTGSPTFTFQWYRDGTPIAGATNSIYTVQAIDEGTTLTCTVTTSNQAGTVPVTSAAVPVPVPVVARCPAATGTLSGSTLGLVTLGMTRKQADNAYTHSSDRGNRYQDFFCLMRNTSGVRQRPVRG